LLEFSLGANVISVVSSSKLLLSRKSQRHRVVTFSWFSAYPMSALATSPFPPSNLLLWSSPSSSFSILSFSALPVLLLRRLAGLPGSAFFRGVFGDFTLLLPLPSPPLPVGSVPVAAVALWVSGAPPVTCLPFSSLNPAFSTMDLKRRCL
jgi:hypothetical protein